MLLNYSYLFDIFDIFDIFYYFYFAFKARMNRTLISAIMSSLLYQLSYNLYFINSKNIKIMYFLCPVRTKDLNLY